MHATLVRLAWLGVRIRRRREMRIYMSWETVLKIGYRRFVKYVGLVSVVLDGFTSTHTEGVISVGDLR